MAGLTSLAQGIQSLANQRRGDVSLLELDYVTDSPGRARALRFQYFPESLSDNKAVNYTPKEIPGGSLPLYQWTSSGERSISFTAIFTCDLDLLAPPTTAERENLLRRIKAAGQESRNVDIRAAVAWLRRYILPRYGDPGTVGVPLTYAPRKLKLRIPGSGIGLARGDGAAGSGVVDPDSILCLMTECSVTYEAFFPSGLPRVCSVGLAFAQIGQLEGAVYFPSATEEMDKVVEGGGVFTYSLQPAKVK